jgi:hypothetical protein
MSTSNEAKAFELWLLHRMEVMVLAHEGQAVANKGIDTRHALYFIVSPVAERSARGLTTAATIMDVATAFPAQHPKRATVALHERGARGGTLECVDALATNVKVALTVARGKTTEPKEIEVGLLEGSRLAPLQFTTVAGSLLDEVGSKTLTVGGVVGGGSTMFMDDLVGLTETPWKAPDVIHSALGWGFRERHTFDLDEKLEVCLLGPKAQVEATSKTKVHVSFWPTEEGLSMESVRAAMKVKSVEVKKQGAAVLGFRLGEGEQLTYTLAMTAQEIRELENTTHEERAAMRVGQGLWTWEVFLRQELEANGAILPQLTPEEEEAVEFVQIRALRAQLGSAVQRETRIEGATIRALFGYTSMRARFTVQRIKLAMSLHLAGWRSTALAETRTRSTGLQKEARRGKMTDHFNDLAERGRILQIAGQNNNPAARFWRDSPTGAMQRALSELAGARASSEAAGEGRRAQTTGQTPRRRPDKDAREETDGTSADEGSPDSDTSDDEAGAMTEWPGDLELKARQRQAARVIYAEDARRGDLKYKEHRPSRMMRAFGPTERWKRKILRQGRGGDDMGAYLATLLGLFRAWPLARGGDGYGPRTCACGREGEELDLHALLDEDGRRCTATGLGEAKERWQQARRRRGTRGSN